MPALVRFVPSAKGRRVPVIESGSGPPLVLLPPGPWALFEVMEAIGPWAGWCDTLAGSVRLLQYEGTAVAAPTPDFSLDAQIEDLHAVVRAAGGRAALFAPQTAGPAALAYAARHPLSVTHLVLWNTVARGVDYYGEQAAAAIRGLLDASPAVFAETISQERFGWGLAPDLAHHVAGLVQRLVSPVVIRQYIAAMLQADVTHELRRVRCPVLVLQRRDLQFPTATTARSLAAALRNVRLLLLDGASMAPWVGGAAVLAEFHAFIGLHLPIAPPAALESDGLGALTAREAEVLALVAQGASNQQVALRLHLTEGTVKSHLHRAYGKLGAASRTQAVAIARERGLI